MKAVRAPEPLDLSGPNLERAWLKLHRGDRARFPPDDKAQGAWRAFHEGDFERAVALGVTHRDGAAAAACALLAQVRFRHGHALRRLLWLRRALRLARTVQDTGDAAGFYLEGRALLYGLDESWLPQLLGWRRRLQARRALEEALRREPRHADAHVALGVWHAGAIDAWGEALAGRFLGASRSVGLGHFRTGTRLDPDSASNRIDAAEGLVALSGKERLIDAERLYAEAAAAPGRDAVQSFAMLEAQALLEA